MAKDLTRSRVRGIAPATGVADNVVFLKTKQTMQKWKSHEMEEQPTGDSL